MKVSLNWLSEYIELPPTTGELVSLLTMAGFGLGGSLILSDLAADPQRALRITPSTEPTVGMDRMLDRLRTDAAHLRIVALPRPLVRL